MADKPHIPESESEQHPKPSNQNEDVDLYSVLADASAKSGGRIIRFLKNEGIVNYSELLELRPSWQIHFLKQPNFGRKTLSRMEAAIKAHYWPRSIVDNPQIDDECQKGKSAINEVWRDISTAPIGEDILFANSTFVGSGYISDSIKYEYIAVERDLFKRVEISRNEMFSEVSNPTHWMPLPKGPSQ